MKLRCAVCDRFLQARDFDEYGVPSHCLPCALDPLCIDCFAHHAEHEAEDKDEDEKKARRDRMLNAFMQSYSEGRYSTGWRAGFAHCLICAIVFAACAYGISLAFVWVRTQGWM